MKGEQKRSRGDYVRGGLSTFLIEAAVVIVGALVAWVMALALLAVV